MLINTVVFGATEVDTQNVFQVPDGLFGFDEIHEYALIVKDDEDGTLRWFQAVGSEVPCFVVFRPDEIVDGFQPVLEKSDLKALGCTGPEDLDFFVIAVVPEDIRKTTVNLKSPIAVNCRERVARQVILVNQDYPIRFPLVEEMP